MASCNGGVVSCVTSKPTSSSSDGDELKDKIIDERKRKRMLSNRESARRSRMRKQKHMDDLTAQIIRLTHENHQIMTSINVTTQLRLNVEAENSVLRAQVGELNNRLQSLNEIVELMEVYNHNNRTISAYYGGDYCDGGGGDIFMMMMMDPWGGSLCANQPVVAAGDVVNVLNNSLDYGLRCN